MTTKNSSDRGTQQKKYIVRPTAESMKFMDPRLQGAASAEKENPEQLLSEAFARMSAGGRQVVDVIAELKDPGQDVPGLAVVTQHGLLVTGTVEVSDLERVSSHDNVLRLSGGDRVVGELSICLPDIQGRPLDLRPAFPPGANVPDGTGVIVGIVDYGCDFLHQNFRKADGKTRVLFLWDQNGGASEETPAPVPYGYGREFSASVLDQALARESAPPPLLQNPFHPQDPQNEAYQFLGYFPSSPQAPAHGTHVMDIAAGNGRGTGAPGVAPNADLIFVHLFESQDPLLDESRQSFANSTRLVQAVDYIFRKARELGRPAVVNLSLGTYGGPHDGTRDADRIFDTMLAEPGRAIVVAAGNSFFLRTHAAGEVSSDSPRVLTWQIRSTGRSIDNEVEIWYPKGSLLEATLIDPQGQSIGPLQLNNPPEHDVLVENSLVMRLRHLPDPINQDNLLNIFLFPGSGLPAGNWRIELRTADATKVRFEAWIDRTFSTVQSSFVETDATSQQTLGSIACGKRIIGVGAYNARGTGRPIASFSSAGPTRDDRQKPEISAPGGEIGNGSGVQAAWSLTHTKTVSMAGTSMASPCVTGLVALLLQESQQSLTAEQIRQVLIDTARRNPPTGNGWHPRYGHGRIDAKSAVAALVAPLAGARQAASVEYLSNGEGTAPVMAATDGVLERMAALVATNRLRMRFQVEIEPYE